MNGRPLTDAQISQALRAHLPESAAPGLRERVFDAAETTTQLRSFPSFLGALSDADPVARRRNLLIAAALLLVLALASAAAVGAWRLLQRDPVDELSLEPPADLPAFVLSSYERLPQLPPLALTWHSSGMPMGTPWGQGVGRGYGVADGRIYVDRSGAVRFDRFASADATEPSSYTILRADHHLSGVVPVGSEPVWVEPGDEALAAENDPRVLLRSVLSAETGQPGCETQRDPSGAGDGTVAAGWQYIGLEDVAGRHTHHVTCGGSDLWIDIETRLILRTKGPAVDDARQPIPGQFSTTEVTEIAFGEQPAARFEPPDGVTRMSLDAYLTYICDRNLQNDITHGISDCPSQEAEATPSPDTTPPPEPSPTPMPTPPGPGDCPVPSTELSEPIGPLAWTPERLNEDWPAPVRPETTGSGSVQPMPRSYLDPMGDNGSTAHPCVDISWVMADTSEVQLKLVAKPPPWSCPETHECTWLDPTEQWIAYGIVTDEDRDGVPDWRYGIDNMPADAVEKGIPRRGWRTNLHTGQTEAGPGQGEFLNGGGFQSGLSNDSADWEPDAEFRFGGARETTQGMQPWGLELDMPFYTWASVIVNGRVVATDYAPDSGWLVAMPGVAITPNKFPWGPYLIEIDHATRGAADPLDISPIRVSMTVPHGWTVGGPWGEGTANTSLEFDVVGHPWDGCPDTIEPTLGPSFDDLLRYLAEDVPQIDISESTDVTVDGYRGRYLRYTGVDKWFDCFSGSPISSAADSEAWIVDVDGVRVVISAVSDEALSEAAQSEIRQIVESIHFER
jgi:hypothetical protein